MGTLIALIAAVGFGTIVAALVAHLTAISNFRQAWINALRDDLAGYFKALEKMNFVVGLYLKDSVKHEEQLSDTRSALFFVFERIRLRLNQTEDMHIQLEKKLTEFLDEPIGEAMYKRTKINEAVELARNLLKYEWRMTKYPWLSFRAPPKSN